MKNDIYVTKTYLPPKEEYEQYLDRIWDSAWLTNMGQLHEELKDRLKSYLNVQGLELFVNGHLALEMALQAVLGGKVDNGGLEKDSLGKGGQIITTPFSFASTTHAIVRQGFTPVFCDIKEDDCTLDASKLEALITDRTVAILPVHVYGNICDIQTIEAVAKKYGLKVIYDAAHAFGEKVDGESVAGLGDVSMISFHATKVFHTIEGGALCYKGDIYDDILYKLKNFGIMGQERVEYVGGNAKMNEFQAAMGLCNLKHIDELIAERKMLTERYIELLSKKKGVTLLSRDPRVSYNYAYMPVLVDGRDELFDKLADNKIHARKYFYPCINDYECYRDRFDINDTPVARDVADRVMTLPLYPGLGMDAVEEICSYFS